MNIKTTATNKAEYKYKERETFKKGNLKQEKNNAVMMT